MRSPICPGEYKCVARASHRLDLLRKAHQTPIKPIKTQRLITELAKTWRTGSIELHIGRAKRGWGGTKRNRGYISLPAKPLPLCSTNRPFGFLRVGLVLHEFAHVVMTRNGKRKHCMPHGAEFTQTLDSLLQFYFDHVASNHRSTHPVITQHLARTRRKRDGQLSLFPEEVE